MKKLTIYPATLIAILIFSATLSFSQQFNVAKKKSADAADAQWYEKAIASIEHTCLHFAPTQTTGQYRGANMNTKNGFLVSPLSFTAENIRYAKNNGNWQVRCSLESISKGRRMLAMGEPSKTAIQDNIVSYDFSNFTIKYENKPAGLEQLFVIRQQIIGDSMLAIRLHFGGNLSANLSARNQLMFYVGHDKNAVKLVYDSLAVYDADHRAVASFMQLDSSGRDLTIYLDDKNATYPLTVDPLTHSPEWSTSADGLLASLLGSSSLNSSLYGYTVTGLGDVNGDGFGDVAVSAPAMANIFSGSGSLASVGAVFVFYGSSNGLSTSPNLTLQPNTAVAGALFGMSVDAGDVTGDGINDMAIGAPLDQVSLSAGLLTLNGTVGKVYVYPGGTSGSANPSNFLALQLNSSYIGLGNVNINPLFGFSVAVTEDLNGDGKKDILIGSPLYASLSSPTAKTGAAFLFLSNASNTFGTEQCLQAPSFSALGIDIPLLNSIDGLLFGYSVDGTGDYNGDGINDVVVGAPAGVALSGLSSLLSGQVLGGQAFIFYGTSNHQGVNTTAGATLEASSNSLLSSTANLFGFKVKGAKNIQGNRNGNVLVGAPLAGLVASSLSLNIQSGTVNFFQKVTGSPAQVVMPTQVIETPRSSSALQVLNTMQSNVLFGAAIDNLYDINCDGYPDIVVGEPLTSGTNISALQTNGLGGSAYVYYGTATGGFQTSPAYTVSATYGSDFLSVNAVALFGFSVAGAQHIWGTGSAPRLFAGSPAGALDFNGLLNIGGTVGTLLSFTTGNDGPGKAYGFDLGACTLTTLPVVLVSFTGQQINESNHENAVQLNWTTTNEVNMNSYEVQKSINGTDFTTIAIVFATEDSSVTANYQYVDPHNGEGTIFYRIRMLDINGNAQLSDVLSFHFISQQQGSVQVYPNPVRTNIQVLFTALNAGPYLVKILNVAGQLQTEASVSIAQYQQVIGLNRPSNMIAGIYWLSVYDNEGNKVQTVKIFAQ